MFQAILWDGESSPELGSKEYAQDWLKRGMRSWMQNGDKLRWDKTGFVCQVFDKKGQATDAMGKIIVV